jgi:DNA-binding NarL/FixJ family response regulator
MAKRRISVLLADDHTVVRQALRTMIEAEPDLVVVGEAATASEALRQIGLLKPDVAVIDLRMPESGGLGVLAEARRSSPRTALCVFTMYDNPTYVQEAVRLGALGYVLKSVDRSEFLRAIRAVSSGQAFLQAEISRPLLRALIVDPTLGDRGLRLSCRELQVIELIADGKTNKEIASVLGISGETVKSHLKRLYEKLGASDRAQAVAIALRQRLIE